VLRLYWDLGINFARRTGSCGQGRPHQEGEGARAALQTKIMQILVIAREGTGRLPMHRAAPAAICKRKHSKGRSRSPALRPDPQNISMG
jgi:hypothetical protein